MANSEYEFRFDAFRGKKAKGPSAFGLLEAAQILIANAIVLAMARWQQWPLAYLLWPYWFQSCLIGVFHYRRMQALQRFSTEGFTRNGERVAETEAGKRGTTAFFALHFGFFHLFYAGFLYAKAKMPESDWAWVLLGAFAFGVGQWLGQKRRIECDAGGKPNLGSMMFLPYVRVLPMHLMMIFGMRYSSEAAIVLFGCLKTLADLSMSWCDAQLNARNAAEKTAS